MFRQGVRRGATMSIEAVDIDWVSEYDPDRRMTVRDRGELRDLFARAVRQAMSDGTRRGVEAAAKVAKDRAECAMLLGNDRMKWERDVALKIEARIRRIVAVHVADPDRSVKR